MIDKIDKQNPIPRYLQVKQVLEDRVRAGAYRPGTRLPGERDLALELGVSQMTVNKGIMSLVEGGWLYREHGNGTFVSEGFRPPLPATLQIGVVTEVDASQLQEDYYLGSLFRGMQQAVADAPVSLSILSASGFYQRIEDASLDGYLIVDPSRSHVPAINRSVAAGKRVVVLSASWDELEVPIVDSDNVGGSRAAIEHLLDLGHRRIACVFTRLASSNSLDRLHAYEALLVERRLPLSRDYIIATEDAFPSTEERNDEVRCVLSLPERPTAFFCAGYYCALETLEVIRERGLRVPEDVSLIAFDDPVSARHITPPLTTVRQPLEAMGRLALGRLLSWLRSGETPAMRAVLENQLVVRGSTALCAEPERARP